MKKIIITLLFIIMISSQVFAGGGGIPFNFDDKEADYYSQHLLMLEITMNDNNKYVLFSDGEVHLYDNNTEIKTYNLDFNDVKAISDTFNEHPFGGSVAVNDGNKYKIDYYLADSANLIAIDLDPIDSSYKNLTYELKDAVYTIIKAGASEDGSLPINLEKEKPVIYEGTELKKVTLILNGKKFIPTSNQMPAVILDDRTLVPVREVFEKLNGIVEWDNSQRKVTVSFGEKTIELIIDSLTAKVNGEDIPLDVPAKIINNKTMVPVRFISEQGGLNVEWDGETDTVIISKVTFASLNTNYANYQIFPKTFLDTGIKIEKIKEISFISSLDNHVVDNENCFDVSDDNSNTILMWVNNIDNNGMYTVSIGQNGMIVANEDSNHLFADMINLEKINNLECMDTSKVNNMSGIFRNCKKIKSLNLSKFNTANVNNMSNMFDGCELLEKLDLSTFNTKRVSYMQNMFSFCKSLSDVNLSSFDTSKVFDMSDMFNGCINLKELDLTSFTRIVKIDNMFKDCSKLKTVYVSNSFRLEPIYSTSGLISNGEAVFEGCTNLVGGKGTKYSSNNTSSAYARIDGGKDNPGYFSYVDTYEATEFIYATVYEMPSSSNENKEYELHFSSTNNKLKDLNQVASKTITKDTNNRSIWGDYTKNIVSVIFDDIVRPYNTDFWFDGFKKLLNIENIEKLDTSFATSMKNMFSGCESLTQIDLSHFNTSNVTDMEMMFDSCSNLTTIDVSGFDTSNVKNMAYMFCECQKLTNLDLSNFDTSNVTSMKFMLSYFKVLTSLDLSNFNTSKVEDMSHMFYWCDNLESINLSSFNTSNVKDMSAMFSACYGLKTIDVSNFNTSNVTNMYFMFGGCKSLTKLDLSSFDTSKVTNMQAMFQECKNLVELNVTSFNTTNVTDMSYMFNQLNKIPELDISNFDTNNTINMQQMFGYCYLLKTIYVSENFVTTSLGYGKSFSMFMNDVSLVGGNGTKFDKNVIDHYYANIDEENRAGYFTKKI